MVFFVLEAGVLDFLAMGVLVLDAGVLLLVFGAFLEAMGKRMAFLTMPLGRFRVGAGVLSKDVGSGLEFVAAHAGLAAGADFVLGVFVAVLSARNSGGVLRAVVEPA